MQRLDENITQKKRFRIFVERTHNILHNPSLPASLALARKSLRHALSRSLNINRNALHWDTLILKVTEDYFLIKPDTWTSVWIGLMHILLGGKAESKTHSYKSFRDSTQSWRKESNLAEEWIQNLLWTSTWLTWKWIWGHDGSIGPTNPPHSSQTVDHKKCTSNQNTKLLSLCKKKLPWGGHRGKPRYQLTFPSAILSQESER